MEMFRKYSMYNVLYSQQESGKPVIDSSLRFLNWCLHGFYAEWSIPMYTELKLERVIVFKL